VSRIVCNSGPLIALGILNRFDLLKELFGEVLVPDAVQREIEAGGSASLGLRAFREATWIRILHLTNHDALLESLLDAGEAAVSTLAREQAASWCSSMSGKRAKSRATFTGCKSSAPRGYSWKRRKRGCWMRRALHWRNFGSTGTGLTTQLWRRH
jgi:predicted nucleic acid-binding protein